jgi:Family of unknown function (DUF5681)
MATDDEKAGYGRPPAHSRFKKGVSGNPKGRPKGSKNLKTDLAEELAERIAIHEGNRTTRISKQRAVVKTLVAKTLKGDARAATTLMTMMYRFLPGDDAASVDQPLDADELEILAALEENLRRKVAGEQARDDSKPEEAK